MNMRDIIHKYIEYKTEVQYAGARETRCDRGAGKS